jgi:hypothetical protein
LAWIAWKTGKKRQAIPLIAVSFGILDFIGSIELNQVWRSPVAMAGDLVLSEEQGKEIVQTALASYQADRGAKLLREAFGPEMEFNAS